MRDTRLEIIRKWLAPPLITLGVAYLSLRIDNAKLEIGKDVQTNYVPRAQYESDRSKQDTTMGKLEAKIDNVNLKLDAALISQTAMQERIRMMQERMK